MRPFLTAHMRELGGQGARCAVLALAVLVQVAYQLGSPILYKFIFDEGIAQGQADVLTQALAVLAGLLAAQSLAMLMQEKVTAGLGVVLVGRLRARLFAKLHQLPPVDVAGRPAGELASLFGHDVAAVELALVRAVPLVLLYGVVIALALALLLGINWLLFTVALASLPAAFILPKLFAGAARRWETRQQGGRDELAGFTHESIATLALIHLFHLQDQRRRRLASHLEHLGAVEAKAHMFGGLVGRTAFIGTSFAQLVVIGTGSVLAVRGHLSAGLLVAFIGLLIRIGDAVAALGTVIPLLLPAVAAHRRLQDFLATEVPVLENPGAAEVGRLRGAISLAGVGFRYPSATAPALSDISVHITPGQRVAVVGASGSGKSTLLALLLRFHAAGEGEIRLDGIPIDAIAEASLRANMGMVPQAVALFDGSIRDNIRIGRLDASDADVVAAAREAGIHDAILARPEGYDTWIRNGGATLSGGERQRIALARALLRQAPILILDEATSALDASSEQVVTEALRRLAGRCTILHITHRLHSLAEFDRILVLDGGRLVEDGTHEQLRSAGGVYARLWSAQQQNSGKE